MKGYFSDIEDDTSLGDDDSVPPNLGLLFSNTESPATRENVLAALPERNIVNRLVSRYFNSNSPAMRELHLVTC